GGAEGRGGRGCRGRAGRRATPPCCLPKGYTATAAWTAHAARGGRSAWDGPIPSWHGTPMGQRRWAPGTVHIPLQQCHGGHPEGRDRASGGRGRWASLTEGGTGPSSVPEGSDCGRASFPTPPSQGQTGGGGGWSVWQVRGRPAT